MNNIENDNRNGKGNFDRAVLPARERGEKEKRRRRCQVVKSSGRAGAIPVA
jgi:hypothetical protein